MELAARRGWQKSALWIGGLTALAVAGCPGRYEAGYVDEVDAALDAAGLDAPSVDARDAATDADRPGVDAADAPLLDGSDAPALDAPTLDAPTLDAPDASVDAGPPCLGLTCGAECVEPSSDPRHCGGCDLRCPMGALAPFCSGGSCRPGGCPPERLECEPFSCVDPQTDERFCGDCLTACGAGEVCTAGACLACSGGEVACASGCADLATDVANCGACGSVCSPVDPFSTLGCAGGTCRIESCNFPRADCDGLVSTGCEVDLRRDGNHCGSCGRACAANELCGPGGMCLPCGGSGVRCGFTCVDLSSDPANCGTCGSVCPSLPFLPGRCSAGVCVPGVCDVERGDCDGLAANGCETDLWSDLGNCGACANACVSPPDTASIDCVGGTCAVASCPPSRADCNGAFFDGCETDVDTSRTNCGACGIGCPFLQQCVAGGCRFCAATETCNGADDDCDALVDESPTGAGVPCGTDTGMCVSGTMTCSGGVLTCVGAVGPATEVCGGGDEDCDGAVDEGAPETCNGLDDDCDTVIDDSPTDAGGACGSGVGECTPGVLSCASATLVCTGAGLPVPETCNGRDDDCDGDFDESLPPGGPCGSDVGACVRGVRTCIGAMLECLGEIGPQPEVCNSVDDDCDASVDEMVAGVGGACGTDVGACVSGTLSCTAGTLSCSGEVGPSPEACATGIDEDCDGAVDETSPEICNGLDDDCDATADESVTDAGGLCGSDVGECVAGVLQCTGGALQCVGTVMPQPEACNDRDDDCDGIIDEDAGSGAACGTDVGECTAGTIQCVSGSPTCVGGILPAPEVCNDRDDDCDASIDEDVGAGGSCGTSVGACQFGTMTCVGGMLVCTGGTSPEPETCNGIDDDCDGLVDDTACTLRISSLDVLGCGARDVTTSIGADRGGLAVGSAHVVDGGSMARVSFGLDLSPAATMPATVRRLMASDVTGGVVYLFARSGSALDTLVGGVDALIPFDPASGATMPAIALSAPITPIGATFGLFSGPGRLAVWGGTTLFEIEIATGLVTQHPAPSVAATTHASCADGYFWGVLEHDGTSPALVYVASSTAIVRTALPSGTTSSVATFSDLGDACRIGVHVGLGRWYWHHDGPSQFRPAAPATAQILGYCDATFAP